MEEPRLKTEFWVKAQLRICDLALLPAVVARRGDADAGQVLVKVNRMGAGCELLARRMDALGRRVWMAVAGGGGPDAESLCDSYVLREADIDPDLWVLEIEDPKGQYRPDGQTPLR
ncbi:MAG: DUF1491 family protein [Alphaproteobacteria bacterium]|nr:DUF1491 family protein [Alphaproteobacteria bacterium]MBF0250362.1 DUF1491 family protein [Alphaproteobacteria bacterium]